MPYFRNAFHSEGQDCGGLPWLPWCKYMWLRLLEGCTSITINHPPPSLQHYIRFSDSSSVPTYTPGWREALGESKVSLTKEELTLNDLPTTETQIPQTEVWHVHHRATNWVLRNTGTKLSDPKISLKLRFPWNSKRVFHSCTYSYHLPKVSIFILSEC